MVTRRKITKKVGNKTSAGSQASAAKPRQAKASAQKKGVTVSRKAETAISFSLGEAIVIANVQVWHEKMLAAISDQDEIILDGCEIEHIDGTGLQLLVAFMKEAVARNVSISWRSASDVLRQNATQLGLTEILGLDKLSEIGQ